MIWAGVSLTSFPCDEALSLLFCKKKNNAQSLVGHVGKEAGLESVQRGKKETLGFYRKSAGFIPPEPLTSAALEGAL